MDPIEKLISRKREFNAQSNERVIMDAILNIDKRLKDTNCNSCPFIITTDKKLNEQEIQDIKDAFKQHFTGPKGVIG